MLKILLSLIIGLNLAYGYEINFDKDTLCEVRQMKVYQHPNWIGKIELADGKNIFFSSPKSLFEFYFQPGRWAYLNIKKEEDFKLILVTDYKTLKAIDAKKAFFVYGSSETSPAGDDLVPFEHEDQAKAYMQKNGGARVLKFQEIKPSLINLLNNKI